MLRTKRLGFGHFFPPLNIFAGVANTTARIPGVLYDSPHAEGGCYDPLHRHRQHGWPHALCALGQPFSNCNELPRRLVLRHSRRSCGFGLTPPGVTLAPGGSTNAAVDASISRIPCRLRTQERSPTHLRFSGNARPSHPASLLIRDRRALYDRSAGRS